MTPLSRPFEFLVIACVTLTATATLANEPVNAWGAGEGRGVRAEHLNMPLTDEENYHDTYTVEAWFTDGTRAYVSMQVKNFGPGTGKLKVRSRWHDANGAEHNFSQSLEQGQYQTTSGPFSISAADHKISGVPRRIKVEGKTDDGYRFQLTFRSGLRPWRPGTGRTTFGEAEEQYTDMTIVQPKAEVTGWVRKGGSKTELSGYGYVLHTHGNIAPYNQFKRFISVRSISGDTVVWMKQFQTPSRYGNRKVGYLYIARGGEVVVATTRFRLRAGNPHTDTQHDNRYRVPFELSTQSERRGRTIRLKVIADEIIGREDILQSHNALERAVIRQYAQPVNYTLRANVHVSVQEGESEAVISTEPTSYVVTHLNR
jgi:hypothetical protein